MSNIRHIKYYQYNKIVEALHEFISQKEEPYDYLYKLVNDFPHAKRIVRWGKPELLTFEQIKSYWNTPVLNKWIIRLAVMQHYKGCFVGLGPRTETLVSKDFMKLYAKKITETTIRQPV